MSLLFVLILFLTRSYHYYKNINRTNGVKAMQILAILFFISLGALVIEGFRQAFKPLRRYLAQVPHLDVNNIKRQRCYPCPREETAAIVHNRVPPPGPERCLLILHPYFKKCIFRCDLFSSPRKLSSSHKIIKPIKTGLLKTKYTSLSRDNTNVYRFNAYFCIFSPLKGVGLQY